jgi:hypothetical protein
MAQVKANQYMKRHTIVVSLYVEQGSNPSHLPIGIKTFQHIYVENTW